MHRGDPLGRGAAQRVDADQQFHQIVVGREAGRLEHEHVLAADVLVDLDEHLLVGEAAHAGVGQRHLEIVGDRPRQRQVAVAGQQFHVCVPIPWRRWTALASARAGEAASLLAQASGAKAAADDRPPHHRPCPVQPARRRPRRQCRADARVARAKAAGADLVMFPELQLTGYPPEDLVLKPEFVAPLDGGDGAAGRRHRRRRARRSCSARIVMRRRARSIMRAARRGRQVVGAAPEARAAQLRHLRREARVRPRPAARAGRVSRRQLGMPICEDIWLESGLRAPRRGGRGIPARAQRQPVRARQGRAAASSWSSRG